MLYSEAASVDAAQRGDDGITVVKFNEHVFSQIRRFVIVNVKYGFVEACGISTYGGRGALKPGCVPSEHTIVYSSGTDPSSCYLPGEWQAGMTNEPIEIIPSNPNDPSLNISPTSRLRFGKTFPIECNVKVKDIGRVHPRDLSKLMHYWTAANRVS